MKYFEGKFIYWDMFKICPCKIYYYLYSNIVSFCCCFSNRISLFFFFLFFQIRSFQIRCLSSAWTALLPSALACQSTVCWLNAELVWRMQFQSMCLVLTDELVHLLWVQIASLVSFYALFLWSAIMERSSNHICRELYWIDGKFLQIKGNQKY